MSRTDLAAILLAAAWTGFVLCTRNGRHAAHVILIAAHRRLVRATGEHGLDQPAGVRAVLRDIGLSAAWHMPRYWWRRGSTPLRVRLRWKLWGLLTRSRRVCPANAHGALIWRTRPLREILVDDECRTGCALNGACWCGNLRDDGKLRAPVAASVPGDGPALVTPVPGAGPLTDATAAVSPYPPPTAPQPALREQLEPVAAARPYVPEMLP